MVVWFSLYCLICFVISGERRRFVVFPVFCGWLPVSVVQTAGQRSKRCCAIRSCQRILVCFPLVCMRRTSFSGSFFVRSSPERTHHLPSVSFQKNTLQILSSHHNRVFVPISTYIKIPRKHTIYAVVWKSICWPEVRSQTHRCRTYPCHPLYDRSRV